MKNVSDNTPVIVGVGEFTQRSREPEDGIEPIDLMAHALREAQQDAGAALMADVDSLDVVCEFSWPYTDAPALLSQRLGITPSRCVYGVTGGESPARFIHEAALRIARGETKVAAIAGAEARYTVDTAAKRGVALSAWTPRDDRMKPIRGADMCHAVARQLGASQPVTVYPLYENACAAHWGLSPREAHQESAALWARYSQVAAHNPHAWLQRAFSASEVAGVTEANRLIAWPYTKHMVANPMVNMGAAVLLTSVGHARSLGMAEDRLVYVWSGAAAIEPRDYLQRDQFHRSHAQDLVLETVLAQVGGDASAFAMMELYSCFPVVPKMARRTLGLAPDAQMTSTGGLSFFGAPVNNYLTHAAAGLVRALRQAPGKTALLYGQGEFITKHHALVLGSHASPDPALLHADYSVQAQADARRGPVPAFVLDHSGPAAVETFTAVYGRHNDVLHGIVMARTPAGQRLMARVEPDDLASLDVLLDNERHPIGRVGKVVPGSDQLLRWSVA